jgi:hypothetical protein
MGIPHSKNSLSLLIVLRDNIKRYMRKKKRKRKEGRREGRKERRKE